MAANAQSIILGSMLILVVLILIAFIIYHFYSINKYCPAIRVPLFTTADETKK